MRLYYIDESEGPRYYVRTALGVDAERWNALHQRVLDWRLELRERYAVPTDRELHACDLLAGRGKLARSGDVDRRLAPEQGGRDLHGRAARHRGRRPDHRRRRGGQRLSPQARREGLRAGQPR